MLNISAMFLILEEVHYFEGRHIANLWGQDY